MRSSPKLYFPVCWSSWDSCKWYCNSPRCFLLSSKMSQVALATQYLICTLLSEIRHPILPTPTTSTFWSNGLTEIQRREGERERKERRKGEKVRQRRKEWEGEREGREGGGQKEREERREGGRRVPCYPPVPWCLYLEHPRTKWQRKLHWLSSWSPSLRGCVIEATHLGSPSLSAVLCKWQK